MAEFVNLRAARKTLSKDKARAKADENAVKFGRTKGQKATEVAEAARAKANLDGVKRDKP